MNKGWSTYMDRRVKERLVGASILVVLIVLIVPELLSGPKLAPPTPTASSQESRSGSNDAVRSVTMDLATNKAMPASDETASAASSADEVAAGDVAPGAAPPAAAVDAGPSIATLQAQAPPSPPVPPPAASPPPSLAPMPTTADGTHHGWAVQLGSFATRVNAEKLERQLRSQGFAASLSPSGSGKTVHYRVRVGGAVDRAAAEKLITKLKQAGHAANVVAP